MHTNDQNMHEKLNRLGALNQMLLSAVGESDAPAIPFQFTNSLKSIIHHELCAVIELTKEQSRLLAVTGQSEVDSESPFYKWLRYEIKDYAVTVRGKKSSQFENKSLNNFPDWLPRYGVTTVVECAGREFLIYVASSKVLDESRIALVSQLSEAVLSVYVLKSEQSKPKAALLWMKNRWSKVALVLFLFCFLPVRQTVVAPAEIIPSNPGYIRSEMKGVIDRFTVKVGDAVKKGAVIAVLDDTALRAEKAIAESELNTSKAEYDQALRGALTDIEKRQKITLMKKQVDTAQAKLNYALEKLNYISIVAPSDGEFLIDDVNNWIGKPVAAGETIAWVANPKHARVQVNLPVNDAIIDVEKGTEAQIYLNGDPSKPVKAIVVHAAYQATPTPQGYLAFTIKADIADDSAPRLGLRGVAKLYGDRAPIIFQWLRRPLAATRQFFGI